MREGDRVLDVEGLTYYFPPLQHAVATVIEAATPFSFPDAANDKRASTPW